jgi:hypothetical protein
MFQSILYAKGDNMFWANDPATTTPISADNLSRLEKYTTATAGANGDFYVNYPVGASLATNDIVYISFPAATNGASNARLSVNNGTTYKNIKLSTIRIASEVASRKLSFVYDGTDFVPLDTEFFPIAFAPTLTPSIGAITSYTSSGYYIKKGRQITLFFYATITNAGTGAGILDMSIPFASSFYSASGGVDFPVTGRACSGYIATGGSVLRILNYEGSTFIATLRTISISISYLTA